MLQFLPFDEIFQPFHETLAIRFQENKSDLDLIEWRTLGRDVVFRPKDENPELVWIIINVPVTSKRPLPKERHDSLAKRLSKGYWRRDFYRLMPLPGDDWNQAPQNWLLLHPNRVVVRSHLQKHGALWRVEIPKVGTKLDYLERPLADLQNDVAKWLQNDPAEWLEAQKFAQCNDEERFWAAVEWRNGSPAQWKELVHALAILHAHQERRDKVVWSVVPPKDCEEEQIHPLLLEESYGNVLKASRTIKRLLKVLDEHFKPEFKREKLRIISQQQMPIRSFGIKIEAQMPSYHEALEASLLWRDWLQTAAPEIKSNVLMQRILS